MRRDYYAVLGVAATAPPREIRQAYRRLARQYSPDVNFWDATARALFEEIAEAYRILSDPDARTLYDRFGARPGALASACPRRRPRRCWWFRPARRPARCSACAGKACRGPATIPRATCSSPSASKSLAVSTRARTSSCASSSGSCRRPRAPISTDTAEVWHDDRSRQAAVHDRGRRRDAEGPSADAALLREEGTRAAQPDRGADADVLGRRRRRHRPAAATHP